MASKHDPAARGFYHLSRAWYGKANLKFEPDLIDQVMFGFYPDGGGTSGEMAMRWTSIGRSPVPRLEVFSDAWSALAQFSDVVAELGKLDSTDPSPTEFCALLLRCGFKDKTPTRDPSGRETDELKADALSKLTPQERAALGV